MSNRNNRNASPTSSTSSTSKGKGKGTSKDKDVPTSKGKGTRVPVASGRVLANKGEDKDVRTQIESLLSELSDARESKDRDAQKGIRRRLRSLGYWGGTRTRTNWIARVPDDKRKDVVSL